MSHSQGNSIEPFSEQEHRGDTDIDKKPKNRRPASESSALSVRFYDTD
jgi:hypothetical protein